MGATVYRNVCPRNCFSSCSMLSYVENGKLMKVTGDAKHGFTQGHLCAKGYAYKQYVYNPLRLKYPMIQSPRGSGNWKRISWDEAYDIIATKIIELNERYSSNLASGYTKYSGNLGILHHAVEGMFNSIGPHTKSVGDICLATGAQAIRKSFGQLKNPYPEQMDKSRAIVIWGANPAVTNIHQMKFIYKGKKNGAKLVVIDPIYTETAMKAGLYVQIKPGTDGWLAIGIAKIMIEKDQFTSEQEGFQGWESFKQYIENNVELSFISSITGVKQEVIEELAKVYGTKNPLATWIGFGLQRNKHGGTNIKAINSLVALSGNLNVDYGGIYYAHDNIQELPQNLLHFPEKRHPKIPASRKINTGNFPIEASQLSDPPLKFLWIASRNPLSQDQHINAWKKLLQSLELVVSVDLYMTNTAKQCDIVLPAASHFEEEDLHVSYWHHWLAFNQKSISPFFEAKSDLKIARELTAKLNELSPGFSTFPSHLEPIDWIKLELTNEVKLSYSITSYEDLIEGPSLKKYYYPGKDINKFKYLSPDKMEETYYEKNSFYPYRLLTPQSLLRIHSQFSNIEWFNEKEDEAVVEIPQHLADKKDIQDGTKIQLFNYNGIFEAIGKINNYLPNDVLLIKQGGNNSINQLIGSFNVEDVSLSSTYFYDTYVDIKKSRDTYE